MLDLDEANRDLTGFSPLAIQECHDKAFDVEAVTKQFFDEYKQVPKILEGDLSGQTSDKTWSHDY